jgi:O-antigen/teichoic acid export membrane protein
MTRLQGLLHQTLIYGLSSILGRFINWALTPFYAHYLTQADFGRMTDVYGLIFYAFTFLTFGLETAFFHFSARGLGASEAYRTAFVGTGLLSLGFGLVCLLALQPLASGLGYEATPGLVVLFVGIVVLDVLAALPMARLRHRERARTFALISISNIGLSLVLNLVFVVQLRWGLAGVFWANFIASGVKLGLALLNNAPEGLHIDRGTLRKMAEYGFWIMLAGLVGAVNELVGRNLIPRLWPDGQAWHGIRLTGETLNGIYAANFKIGMFVALMTQAFRYAAEPFFFRQSGRQDAPLTYARVFHYFSMLGLVAFLVVSAFRYEFVSFTGFGLFTSTLLPRSYWVGLEVVPLVLLANVFYGMYLNLSFWYKVSGRPRVGLLIASVGVLVTVGTNVLSIPYLGYMGSAWGNVLCYATMCMLCYVMGQYEYPVPYRLKRLGIEGGLIVCTWLLVEWLGTGPDLAWGVVVAKSGAVSLCLGCLYWLETRYPVGYSVQRAEHPQP